MEKLSSNLCEHSGKDALEILFKKILDPELPVRVGSFGIRRIVAVENYGSSIPVISIETDEDTRMSFEFYTGHKPFGQTAVDDDGNHICPPPPEV